MRSLFLVVVLGLVGCASTPMTEQECRRYGGDAIVPFGEESKCCRTITIDTKNYCKEVKRPKPSREPRAFIQ